jgi:AmmeMemoRadiSam system protein B
MMSDDRTPAMRRDLDFFPVQHGGKQYIIIRDHLGLVQEGKAIDFPLYQVMTLLDGTMSIRDLQMALMRQRGGMLVASDEVRKLLDQLDGSFLLDSERFKEVRDQIVERFASMKIRPCSHCGQGYPLDPSELRKKLDEILSSQPPASPPEGKIVGLVAPHIDLAVGFKSYARAYQLARHTSPSKVILLGIGHQLAGDFFCLTEKDFDTPLGIVKTDRAVVRKLREAGNHVVAPNDFAHRSEHSIEFQVLFLQHLLSKDSFTIVPIICGSLLSALPEYNRDAYLEKAGNFLVALKEVLRDESGETLLIAGVDFSHIGPKFGHEMPARYLQGQSEAHDRSLLNALAMLDAGKYWEESRRVRDKYNVCGFAAMACLLEVVPHCKGKLLHYQTWHEQATQSAVSFGAAVFVEQER